MGKENLPDILNNLPGISKKTEVGVDAAGNQYFRMTGSNGNQIAWGKYAVVSQDNTTGQGRKEAIIQMEREGFSRREIANAFNISESRVSQIINGK